MNWSRRAVFRTLLLVSICLLASCLAFADDWPPIDPADLALKSIPQQPGAPAVVLLRNEDDNDPLHYHSTYERIKILTEAGREYADVELPYNRKNFRIDSISGRTIHADGSIVEFNGKPFDKTVQKNRGYRVNVKAFSLPDVQVGSIIEYRYSLRYDDHSYYSPDWEVQRNLFQKQANFKFTPYQFQSASRFLQIGHEHIADRVSWTSYLPKDTQPKDMKTPRSEWIELAVSDVPPLLEEPYSPPPRAVKMRVNFYYTDGAKVEDYWKTENKYWNKDVENFVNHRTGAFEVLAKILAPDDTAEQKARKIYSFVTTLENRSYIPARAVQEEHALGILPNKNAEDVLRQHSGDHDELNRTLVALLHQAEIPARMMWVPDRTEIFFDRNYLSTSQFDGEIAIAELGGKEVFLDPGTKYCPYGMLNWHYAGNQGLRQSDSKNLEFADAPLSGYNDAMIQRLARVKLTDDGRYEGIVTVGFGGLEGMEWRRTGGLTDEEGRKKALEEEMRKWLPAGSEIQMTKKPKWDDTESMVAAEFKVSGNLATSAGKRWLMLPHLFEINEKPKFPSAQRANGVYLYYPYREIDEVHITLPSGVDVESLPPDDTVKTDFAIYTTQQKMETPVTVFSRRDLAVAGMAFPNSVYKEVKDFYDKVKAGDDQPALLKATPHAQGN
jgi:Domain of Unknown Function with PDB structure (DUF3857)/Transglutaminase-like superfamily